jgi:putative spermidine/putrescine transport system ATP-binding protein
MADRVAVFNHGRVVQVGTPEEIYERPQSRFVADFVGGSNVFEPALVKAWTGVDRAASVRPEKIALVDADARPSADFIVLDGRVVQVLYHGAVSRIEVITAEAGRLFLTISSATASPQQGGAARVSFLRKSLHLMEPE